MVNLFFDTISPILKTILIDCMQAPEFNEFRLVGGTALSLQLGHRKSDDIDLFTDAPYRSVNFELLDNYLKKRYPYIDALDLPVAGGKSYYVGEDKQRCIKLDLYYTDKYIDGYTIKAGIRIATIEEIIAMKMDVILRGGRKKDFWDIHELTQFYSYNQMVELHTKRYPYSDHNEFSMRFTDFSKAEGDFTPICLKGKEWEIIKLDLIDFFHGVL